MSCIPCCGPCLVTFWEEECCCFLGEQSICHRCTLCCDSYSKTPEENLRLAVQYKLNEQWEKAVDYLLLVRESNRRSTFKVYLGEVNYLLLELVPKVGTDYLKGSNLADFTSPRFLTDIEISAKYSSNNNTVSSNNNTGRSINTNRPLDPKFVEEMVRVRLLMLQQVEKWKQTKISRPIFQDRTETEEREYLTRIEREKRHQIEWEKHCEQKRKFEEEHPEVPLLKELLDVQKKVARHQNIWLDNN